jgi:WD40 repeat protein
MVTSLAFSPDGKILASSGYDLFIKFWDVASGRLLGQISMADTPNFLAFSPDGSKLAVASNLEVSLVDPVSMQIEQSVPEVVETTWHSRQMGFPCLHTFRVAVMKNRAQ